MLGLKGYIPVHLKPDWTFCLVMDLCQAGQKTEKNPFWVTHNQHDQTNRPRGSHSTPFLNLQRVSCQVVAYNGWCVQE